MPELKVAHWVWKALELKRECARRKQRLAPAFSRQRLVQATPQRQCHNVLSDVQSQNSTLRFGARRRRQRSRRSLRQRQRQRERCRLVGHTGGEAEYSTPVGRQGEGSGTRGAQAPAGSSAGSGKRDQPSRFPALRSSGEKLLLRAKNAFPFGPFGQLGQIPWQSSSIVQALLLGLSSLSFSLSPSAIYSRKLPYRTLAAALPFRLSS